VRGVEHANLDRIAGANTPTAPAKAATAEIPNVFVNTAEKRDELPPLHVLL
jgi:hypothetical protein